MLTWISALLTIQIIVDLIHKQDFSILVFIALIIALWTVFNALAILLMVVAVVLFISIILIDNA